MAKFKEIGIELLEQCFLVSGEQTFCKETRDEPEQNDIEIEKVEWCKGKEYLDVTDLVLSSLCDLEEAIKKALYDTGELEG